MPETRRSPLTRLRAVRVSPAAMRRCAVAAIVTNAGIVVTGGAVRLSNSGLGCPTWPDCTAGRILPGGTNTHGPLNQAIEFGNRMLGFLVFFAAVACVLAAWRLRPRRPGLLRIAWLLPAGVAFQGILGGITVRVKLNPLAVIPHFLASMVLVYISVWLYVRATEGDGPPRRLVRRELQWATLVLVTVLAAVEIAGTFVTATGPHAGNPGTRRLGWDPRMVTQFHADLVFLYVGVVLGLLLALRATNAPQAARRRGYEVLGVVVLQGTIGYVQYFLHVPAVLVGLHMFGATLATICTARLYFATRTRAVTAPEDDMAAWSAVSDEANVATRTGLSAAAQRGAAH